MRKATRLMLMNDEFDKSRNENRPMSRAGITDRNFDPGEPDWDERAGRAPMANRRNGERMGAKNRMNDGYERERMRRTGREDDDDDDDDEDSRRSRKNRNGRDWRGNRIYASGTVYSEPGEHGGMMGEVDAERAHKWVEHMHNADGSTGAHYAPEKAEQLRKAHFPEGDKWEWFVAINMMYSDYMPVAKKMGMDKEEFYCGMAKAFLEDPDAGENKLEKYMKYIPKDI